MTTEEQLKIYAAYLPYGLELQINEKGMYFPYPNHINGDDRIKLNLTEVPFKIWCNPINWNWLEILARDTKPILYDLSYLTKEIEHEGRVFIPIDVFEITDHSDSYSIEYDHGNIKLIRDLKSIAENNLYFDIQFLPFEVVQRLISWHFNVFNLPAGEFIDKATLKTESNETNQG